MPYLTDVELFTEPGIVRLLEAGNLARGVKIWVLAHLNVRLSFLSFHVFKCSPLPSMPSLNPLLSTLKESQQSLRMTIELTLEAASYSFGTFWSIPFNQDVIVNS
jgi:hypothetical protein